MKVGIVNCFIYINMINFLKEFTLKLKDDIEVVVSPSTTKQIMDDGIEKSVDETCLPVKVFIGHIEYLIKNQVDIILLPRITSVGHMRYSCPKIIGLPDMIKAQYKYVNIFSPEIDLNRKNNNLRRFLFELGKGITNNTKSIEESMKGINIQSLFDFPKNKIKGTDNILFLGHNYIMFDKYLNCNLIDMIKNYNYNPLIPEYSIGDNRHINDIDKPFFWNTAESIYKSFYNISDQNNLKGVIYIMSFGCGIDSIVEDIIKRRAKKLDIPYVCITIDEHSANVGFQTRIEAFIDMIEWRRSKYETNISSYGKSLSDS